VNDNYIPANALINWSNAGLLPNSRTGGLEPVTPMQADRIEIVTNSYPWSQIQGFISNAPAGQTTVIYFPGGIYYLYDPIELQNNGSVNNSNIIFQGAGATSTFLIFMGSNDEVCFDIQGGVISNPETITANINKGATSFSCSHTFTDGSWIQFWEDITHTSYTDEEAGQITQIVPSSTVNTMKDEASKLYTTSFDLKARSFQPIVNVGIENLTIWRKNANMGNGINVRLNFAVNCWIKGVHSMNTCKHHMYISHSSHIEVSGSIFHKAAEYCHYNDDSWGYGIVLSQSSTNCLIENNIFHHLRHSMGIIAGANCNVFTYNYSTDPWAEIDCGAHGGLDIYRDSDICLHGKYSYANLYEHNYVVFIEADPTHDEQGPYNAFVRNKTHSISNVSWLVRIFNMPNQRL